MIDLEAEFPILRGDVFLNHATVAPISGRAARAMREWIEQAQTSVATDWNVWYRRLGPCRENAAAILGAQPSEIAFVQGTTHGLLVVAGSIPWRPGDNVVGAAGEFPGNVYPWRNLAARGVAFRQVRPRGVRYVAEDFLEAIDARTRLVAVSLVQFASGFRMPVERLGEICRERGILFCLDGIQGVGSVPTDVKAVGCDFLAANGHKWFLSPEGFGILYVRREILDRLDTAFTGWMGRERPGNYDDPDRPIHPWAKRYEAGSYPLALATAFEKSTELLIEVGIDEVWRRIEELTGRLREGLRRGGWEVVTPDAPGEHGAIVAARREGVDPELATKRLAEEGIHVAARGGFLRIAPHFYNRPEQIDRCVEALGRAIR